MKDEKRVLLLFGRKLGMARICDSMNRSIAVTAIHVDPCQVVALRTVGGDGYSAIQVGADEVAATRISHAEAGHCAKNGCKAWRKLMEIRVSDPSAYSVGEILDLTSIGENEQLDVAGITKGHGFQGVMKRYGFSGGPDSHGSMFHRRGGSYGQREEPGRIYRGRKMPGHMGATKRTAQNVSAVRVCADRNLLFVRGSVPGFNGSLLSIRTAKKG
ncbi:MAG: 50S ribosomal protein L3 [Puniceicoccales bacterium]|nr:50S ribosomal protein L3 [Puniceicoccales bacterium]